MPSEPTLLPHRLSRIPNSNLAIFELPSQVKIVLPDDLAQITPYVIAEQGDWFEEEIRFVRHYLKPGMRILDIGANFGTYSLTAARCVGENGKVWSLEPIPSVGELLRKSVLENEYENVSVHQLALSNSDGVVRFNVSSNTELSAIASESDAASTIEVETRSLDSFAKKENLSKIDFLKLDAEGVEVDIIKNGQKFLTEESPLALLEIKKDNEHDLAAFREIKALGYQGYLLLPEHRLLVPVDENDNLDTFWLNLFVCRPDKAKQLEEEGMLVLEDQIEDVPEIDSGLLQTRLNALAFGREVLELGTLNIDPSDQSQNAFLLGLNYFVASLEKSRDPKSRYACLLFAKQEITRAIQTRITLARALSLARVEYCLHQRSSAVQILSSLLPEILQQPELPFDEPFLSPSREFEAVDPKEDLSKWVIANVIEQKIRLQHFTTLFNLTEAAEDFVKLNENGFYTTTMDDRAKTLMAAYKAASEK